MAKTEGQVKSVKQENRITKSLNQLKLDAKRQIASGAKWFAKSDVVSSMFQVEAKTRAKPSGSISVKKEWYDKIEMESLDTGKIPVLVYSFGDSTDYYSLRDRDFMAIMDELLELRSAQEEPVLNEVD